MKYDSELVISRYLNVNPIEINSALLSAQNRVRLYWTNINNKPVGLFGDMEPDIPQPKDAKIYLRDILESDVDEKYYLSEKMIEYFRTRAANFNAGKINIRDINDKASAVTASSKSVDISDNFIMTGVVNDNGDLKIRNDKSMCIDANYNKGVDNHQQRTMIVTHHLEFDNKIDDVFGIREIRNDDAKKERKENQKKGIDKNAFRKKDIARRDDGKTGTIGTQLTNDNLIAKVSDQEFRIRKLTPIECERLQTVPDNYTAGVSNTRRYHMLGNGWTVAVIKHIFSFAKFQ